MAKAGIVGDYNGSKARTVVINPDEWKARKTTMLSSNVAEIDQ